MNREKKIPELNDHQLLFSQIYAVASTDCTVGFCFIVPLAFLRKNNNKNSEVNDDAD